MVDVMASMFEFDRADITKVDQAIDNYYRYSLSNTLAPALDTASSVVSPFFLCYLQRDRCLLRSRPPQRHGRLLW